MIMKHTINHSNFFDRHDSHHEEGFLEGLSDALD